MIEILNMQDTDTVGFRISGQVEAVDINRVFEELKNATNKHGKIKMYIEVPGVHLSDLSAKALKADIQLWLKHPGLISQISKMAFVTDTHWLKTGFEIESALIPTMTGKSFLPTEKAAAKQWLRTDQRAASRMDLTLSEFVETAALKAAGGFALGLLTASLFSGNQRKNVGKAILFGGIAIGIPLAIKVLNNNGKLLTS